MNPGYNINNNNYNYNPGLDQTNINKMKQGNYRNNKDIWNQEINNNFHYNFDEDKTLIDKNPEEDHKNLSQSFKNKMNKNIIGEEDKKPSDSRSYRSHLSNLSNKNTIINKDYENNYNDEMKKSSSKNKYEYNRSR